MKKFIVLLLTVVVTGLVFAGCVKPAPPAPAPAPPAPAPENPLEGIAIKPDGTPYKFEHVANGLGFDWTDCFDGVIHSLLERAGGEVHTTDPMWELEKQIAGIEDAIVKRPDVIFLSAVESEALWPSVDKVLAAGIPFYDYDVPTHHPGVFANVTHDQIKRGETCAQWLIDYAKETGEHVYVYEIWGDYAMDCSQERHQGFQSVADRYPDLISVMESPNCHWSETIAMDAVADAFPAHPELNAIWSHGGSMTLGTNASLEAMDRLYPIGNPRHIPIVVMDEDPPVLDAIRSGLVDACSAGSPWEIADMFAKLLLTELCLKEPAPDQILIEPYMVTIENIDSPPFGAPMLWGDMIRTERNFDLWPILDTPEYIATPSKK